MHQADQLLRGILDQPGDVRRRLVFADWLEEQGDARNAARADLLRLQCAWERHPEGGQEREALAEKADLLVEEHEGLVGPLVRVTGEHLPLPATGLSLVLFASAAVVPLAADRLDARSVWRGELRQLSYALPTEWEVREREGNVFRGEMEQSFRPIWGINMRGRFSFKGVTLCGRPVAFVTDALEGDVLVPGLYLAGLEGDTLEGTWRVPHARQEGTFDLRRGRNRRPA
jgi:uncharacterized protein (TIGR02996 family)